MPSLFDVLCMFWGNFFLVFLLGIQSKNVNQSRYVAAMVTSAGISVAQAVFIKYVATGSLVNFSICALGGAIGIASAIFFHDHIMKRRSNAA